MAGRTPSASWRSSRRRLVSDRDGLGQVVGVVSDDAIALGDLGTLHQLMMDMVYMVSE